MQENLTSNKEKKIRILILPSWYPPDGGGFFRDHAESLKNAGFEVEVVVRRFLSVSEKSLKYLLKSLPGKYEITNGVPTYRKGFIKIPLFTRLSLHLWKYAYKSQIRKHFRDSGLPDIIIVQSAMWAGRVAVEISEEYSIPIIIVEHRSRLIPAGSGEFPALKNWELNWLKDCYSKASGIVAVSPALLSSLISILPAARHKMRVIPNMLGPVFLPEIKTERKGGKFIFISFGLLENRKGFKYLLHAFRKFLDENEGEFELRIGGRGNRESELKELSTELELRNHVVFTGRIERTEVRKELEAAHVFVLPSLSESFGVVLIEAMATGLPVIATRCGGPEYIVTPDSGMLVSPGDSNELALAMNNIFINFGKYDSLKIRYDVINRYGPEEIVNQYRQLINTILNEPNKPEK